MILAAGGVGGLIATSPAKAFEVHFGWRPLCFGLGAITVFAAVLVFIARSVIHLATGMHKSDFKNLRNEDALLEAMRAQGIEPGAYRFPFACSMKEMGSPEMLEKLKRGPVGLLTILPPGGINMGRSLLGWFLYTLVVGMFVAYLGWHALGAGAPYLSVFRITGAAAVLAYALGGHITESIWKGLSWGTAAKFVVDGIIYGLVTAGTFGWLWPGAAS